MIFLFSLTHSSKLVVSLTIFPEYDHIQILTLLCPSMYPYSIFVSLLFWEKGGDGGRVNVIKGGAKGVKVSKCLRR